MGHEAKTADDVFYRSMSMPGANNDSRDAELLVLDLLELDNDISRREGMDGFPGFVHRENRLLGWQHKRNRG
jgi:hypothetical protein